MRRGDAGEMPKDKSSYLGVEHQLSRQEGQHDTDVWPGYDHFVRLVSILLRDVYVCMHGPEEYKCFGGPNAESPGRQQTAGSSQQGAASKQKGRHGQIPRYGESRGESVGVGWRHVEGLDEDAGVDDERW